jgi:hypothetical protein
MKTTKLLWPIVAILLLVAACAKQPAIADLPVANQKSSTHLVPTDVALASLNAFLGNPDDGQTKSSALDNDVAVIRLQDIPAANRPSCGDTDCDALVYIVNLGNDGGYAILAADDRIGDDVIAVVDEGSITAEELLGCYDIISSSGDNAPTEEDHLGAMLYKMCLDYATKQVTRVDSLDVGGDDIIEMLEAYSQTFIVNSVSPMLTAEVGWRQTAPFNDFCPILGNGLPAYTGCVPLAVSKIFAYFEYPAYISYNNVPVDWTALKTNFLSTTGSQSAAALLRFIGVGCNSMYFSGGTFTLPGSAKNFMEDCFYSNVSLDDYSTSSVVSMLEDDCPLFICSLPHNGFLNYDFANSHAWNIDGYKTTQKVTTYFVYINGIFDHTELVYGTYNTKVHCDFGWRGNHNGYYASGVFQLNAYGIEYDDPTLSHTETTNYNYYLKIITYDNPS